MITRTAFVSFFSLSLSIFLLFLQPHLLHMEVPRLGGRIGAASAAYATTTATLDPSHFCHLCHSLRQHQILNPLIEARDQTCIPTETMSGP